MNTEATASMVGWLITDTHDEDDKRRVGYGQKLQQADQTTDSYNGIFGRTIYVHTDLTLNDIPYDKRVKWRSFSDDGDPAYEGCVHIDWLFAPDDWPEEHQELAYNVDRFCMEDWGAVCVAYNGADIKRCRPDLADFVDRQSICQYTPNTTYFEIY
jgi:hypothetical protein